MRLHNSFIELKLLVVFVQGYMSVVLLFLPLFFKNALAFGNGKIGLIMALIPFISAVAFPYWTSMMDRTGAFKKVMILNKIIALLCMLSVGFVPYFFRNEVVQTILILSACAGYSFFGNSFIALMDALIIHVLADQKALFGNQKIGTPIGIAIPSFATGFLMERLGSTNAIFIVYTICSFGVIVTIAFIEVKPRKLEDDESTTASKMIIDKVEQSCHKITVAETDENSALLVQARSTATLYINEEQSIWHLLKSPEAVQFFTSMVLTGLTKSILISYLFLFFEQDLHASATNIGLLGPLGALAQIPCFFYSKRIYVRFGAFNMLIIAQCLNAIRCIANMLASGQTFGVYLATAAQSLHGVSLPFILSASALKADSLAPPHLKSSVQGLLNMCYTGIGVGMGAIFGGLIYEFCGASTMWAFAAFVAVISSLILCSTNTLRKILFVPLARAIENCLVIYK